MKERIQPYCSECLEDMPENNQEYHVKLMWDEAGYFIEIEEMPSVFSCGKDIPDALEMLADAYRMMAECALEDKVKEESE